METIDLAVSFKHDSTETVDVGEKIVKLFYGDIAGLVPFLSPRNLRNIRTNIFVARVGRRSWNHNQGDVCFTTCGVMAY